MRNDVGCRGLRSFQHGKRLIQEILLTHAGDEAALHFEFAARGEAIEDRVPEFVDAFTCERGDVEQKVVRC